MNVSQVAKLNPSVLIPLMNPMNPQQTRQARRLYIGNIPSNVTEPELAQFFNAAMSTAKLTKEEGNAIVAVQMNFEKSFAFVELRSMEEATAGMALDGITLHGQSLKVRRPKDYSPGGTDPELAKTLLSIEPEAAKEDELGPEGEDAEGMKKWVTFPVVQPQGANPNAPAFIPGIVSTNVPDSPNKIFIGGLPAYLTEEQVKELLSSFGPLKSFNLVKDSITGNSKGYAFFEYLDEGVTDKACKGLNGMKLQEKTLLVQRANIGAKHIHTPQPNVSLASINPTAATFLNFNIPTATILSQLPGMVGPSAQIATTTIVLLNMATPEELSDDQFYNDFYEDIQEECSKYGTILSLNVPKGIPEDYPNETPQVKDLGKVFVEYLTLEQSKNAQLNLAGRRYNNRTVITTFLQPDSNNDFNSLDFNPEQYNQMSGLPSNSPSGPPLLQSLEDQDNI